MNPNFEQIKDYFERIDKERLSQDSYYFRETEVGFFYPSSLVHLDSAIEQFIANGIIDVSALFGDAGCGDGRILALTAGRHNIPSIGIEYDPEIAEYAKANINELTHLSILNGTPIIIVRGDFTEDETHTKVGIRFEDIRTWFNYINNQKKIATMFLLYYSSPIAEEFAGLTLEETLELVDESKLTRRIDMSDLANPIELEPAPQTAYLHVYRK